MHCCERCFKDSEIKAIIRGNNTLGKCDFCYSDNVFICNLENNEYLRDNFESLLDVYTPINEMGRNYPKEKADLIKNVLCSQWSIFNLNPDGVYKFLISLLPEKYHEQPALFDNPIGISGSVDDEYMNRYSILGTYQWEDFVREIKEKNRFHTNIINKDILKTILLATCKQYKAGSIFYRARIWNDRHGFDKDHMGAPPALKASAGRANPEGISPFQEIDCSLLAINLPHLRKIGYEISKPLRRHDSPLDYLPTQYISDYIKSVGFAGIEYKSTMCKKGVNFAIFDETLFECIGTESYEIDSLTYGYSMIE